MSINNSRQSIRSIRKSILRKRKRGTVCFTVLIGLIVAASAYFAFVQSGVSLENQPICGFEEHIHTESCFCQPVLICGYEATAGHMHSIECNNEATGLVCDIPEMEEHIHSDECYYIELELICDKKETGSEEAITPADKAVGVESLELTDEAAAEKVIEPHKHSEECYRPALICEIKEHTHNIDCYEYRTGNVVNSTSKLMSSSSDKKTAGVLPSPMNTEEITDLGESATSVAEETTPVETPAESPEESPAEIPEGDDDNPEIINPGTSGGEDSDKTSQKSPAYNEETNKKNDIEDPAVPTANDPTVEPFGSEEVPEPEEELLLTTGMIVGYREAPVEITTFTGGELGELYNMTASVATVTIPIVKVLEGEGIEDVVKGMDPSQGFQFDAVEVEKVVTPQGIEWRIREDGRELSFDSAFISSKTLIDNDFSLNSEFATNLILDFYDYKEYYVRISENNTTAGAGWIYDDSELIIRVEIVNDTVVSGKKADGYIKVTNAITGELLYLHNLYTYLTHSRTGIGNEYFVPDLLEYDLKLDRVDTFKLFSYPYDDYIFIIKTTADPEVEIPTLCADWMIKPPDGHENVIFVDNVDHSATALSFALFKDIYGAMLSDEDFWALFKPDYKDYSSNLRMSLMQFSLWYFAERKRDTNPASDWGLTPPIKWPKYRVQLPFGQGPADLSIMDDAIIRGGEPYVDLYLSILREIDKMMEHYSKNGDGECIASLLLEYKGTGSSGSISVGYDSTGYVPASHDLILTWTGTASVSVNSATAISTGSVKVRPGDDIQVTGISGEVVFTISDPMYYLANGSIRGSLFYAINENGNPKWETQRMVDGYAEFLKLAASVTVCDTNYKFSNTPMGVVELPATIGLNIDKFIITGTMLMLTSATLLFANGVRPVRQGLQDENKARLLSLVGKRTRKRWYSGRRRE